ncbi:No apical meristem-associated C-terminal domain containing protein [Nitzschia inconspicua]|uniref:No apical meristem-associated C-terminal domain containing protein n=1 Tax=Nitzschia inconspicua TaxID=303405 RepID=A0A9K3L0C2_9STRA|nr:No apical meristem-associated C-terminal domain containing protein [Nitzschia inconspicua]
MATRPKNFTPIEDVRLCRAYVNATLNPITGTDQKMEVFWRGIKGKFDELYAEADEVQEGVPPCSIEELLAVTGAVNQNANGKSTTNTIGKPMGSKIPRPIGQKAAKRKAQEEISVGRSQKTRTASLVQMTAIHERLAKSMEDNNQIDIRYKEFQMLKEIGDVEGSRKCIEEIQQLQASIDGRASASIDCRASFSSGSDEDDANDSPMVPVVVTAPGWIVGNVGNALDCCQISWLLHCPHSRALIK